MSLQVYDEHNAVAFGSTISDAEGTTLVSITQGGAKGTHLDALVLSSSSVTPHDVQIWLDTGAPFLLGTVALPAGAGQSAAVPAVDVIAALPWLTLGLVLPSGYALKWSMVAALLAGELATAIAIGGEF